MARTVSIGEKDFGELQGALLVIFLSFAGIKETNYPMTIRRLSEIMQTEYIKNYFLLESDVLTEGEKKDF